MRLLSGEVRSIRRKVLYMHKTWNGLKWKKAPDGCVVAMRWHAFCSELVRSLSCTCPVRIRWCPVDLRLICCMSCYALACNRLTGGVPDTDRMFSGRLLIRNVWKLTNNGCETVVHGTKLMTYIFWGIIKLGFPVSLSPVQKTFCQLLMRCTFVLPGTCPLLVRRCPLFWLTVNCSVHVR